MTGRTAQYSYPDTHYRELVTISKIKMRHRNCFTESSCTLLKMVEIPRLNIWFYCFVKECVVCQNDQASGGFYLCAEVGRLDAQWAVSLLSHHILSAFLTSSPTVGFLEALWLLLHSNILDKSANKILPSTMP